jgi:hypothetical protein
MPVNTAVQTEWLRRLRSGTIPQTKRHLKDQHGYCCFGVLCDVAMDMGLVQAKWSECPNGDWEFVPNVLYSYATQMPNKEVLDLVGMASLVSASTYSEMNDMGKTFSEIANKLEEEFNRV